MQLGFREKQLGNISKAAFFFHDNARGVHSDIVVRNEVQRSQDTTACHVCDLPGICDLLCADKSEPERCSDRVQCPRGGRTGWAIDATGSGGPTVSSS